jgi:hypothetical protein
MARFDRAVLPPEDLAPVIEWTEFLELMDWRQDQHVAMVGPTGQGKTNATYHLLAMRDFVAYFSIKPQDRTLERFAKRGGYTRIESWPPMIKRMGRRARPAEPEEMPRRLLWPDATRLDSEETQRVVFRKALGDIYTAGGWCTVLDDYWYFSTILGFEKDTKKFLMNARSNMIPLVICLQRPAGARIVEIFDQSDHLFFFRDNDERNLKSISGVGYLAAEPIKAFVANLERYQMLYINTRSGAMYRTSAPELKL